MNDQQLFEEKLEAVAKKHGFKKALAVRMAVVKAVEQLVAVGEDGLFLESIGIINSVLEEMTKTTKQ